MRAVIDTNCLLPSIPSKNVEYWLYKSFRSKDFDWVISNDILLEYEEKISEFYSSFTADLVINILLSASNVIRAEPFFFWNLITHDPDDNKFADIAISANADYLVSNDHHFNVLKNAPVFPIKVVKISEFQKIMGY